MKRSEEKKCLTMSINLRINSMRNQTNPHYVSTQSNRLYALSYDQGMVQCAIIDSPMPLLLIVVSMLRGQSLGILQVVKL
jgi:hypothetical protein